MFFIKLLNFIRGYVIILIEGAFPERFLNICARRSIYLWNVKRVDKLSLKANVSIKGFRLMPEIAKKARCRVRLKGKKGLPFILHRHRKRKAFAAGAAIFILTMLVLAQFIWVIDVKGNINVNSEQILQVLEQAGLKTGMPKGNIDEYALQRQVMLDIDEIAWISVQIKGTTAHVEVKEREPKPEIFPKDKPCNIVAAKDGVIESIDAVSGKRLVSAGDVVKQGQLLVSGALDSNVEGVRYVHSEASISARTWYEFSEEIPKYEEIKRRTGKSKSKHAIKILNFYIKFFINDRISYANYDRISKVKKLSFGKSVVLPISFHYDKYYELEIEQKEMDRETALKIAEENAFKKVKGKQIVKKDIEKPQDILKITYECLEDIGVKQDILKEENTSDGEVSGSGND